MRRAVREWKWKWKWARRDAVFGEERRWSCGRGSLDGREDLAAAVAVASRCAERCQGQCVYGMRAQREGEGEKARESL